MPGIAQGYSMAASSKIDALLHDAFPEEQKFDDAVKALQIMYRAGICKDVMLENTLALFLFPSALLGLGPLVRKVRLKRQARAKAELAALVNQNPPYWNEVIDRVHDAVVQGGNVNHSLLGSRQVTELSKEE